MNDRYRRDYERLVSEISGPAYATMLAGLGGKLAEFKDWNSVIEFMREGVSRDPVKDDVLRPILAAHQEDQDPRWRTILLTIFWPGLRSLAFRKRFLDRDPEDLWGNIQLTFLEVLIRIDVSKRPDCYVQKIINDTTSYLGKRYKISSPAEVQVDPNVLADRAGASRELGFAEANLRIDMEFLSRFLRRMSEKGIITESDCDLIIGTRIYVQSIADYARQHGLSYKLVKKRRQRAEARIQEHVESTGAHSPFDGSTPLLPNSEAQSED